MMKGEFIINEVFCFCFFLFFVFFCRGDLILDEISEWGVRVYDGGMYDGGRGRLCKMVDG